MDYKEKILEKCKWQRKEDGETYVFRAMHMKYLEKILNSLPSEKEIAKGVLDKFIASLPDNDYAMDYWRKILRTVFDWLDKEAE